MKSKGLYIALFVLLMVLLFMPMLQQFAHPFNLRKLDGAALQTEKPELSFESYKDMSYQSQLEKYVSEQFGLREWVIRLYNQYLWNFRKTYAADVVVGKDKWLFGIMAAQNHYRQLAYEFADNNEAMMQKLEKDADRLKKVQDLFEHRGIKCFMMICPSKDVIYPEYLPEHGKWVMKDGLLAVDYCREAFAKRGINFLDLNTWFAQIKDSVDYPIFPQTGLHWSDIASVHAADTMIRYMEHLTGKNLNNIQIGPAFQAETTYPDNDLEKSMNLIWPIQPNSNLYAHTDIIPDSTAQQLRLLTVGDSFFWNFGYVIPMDKIFKTYHHWYYFNSVFFDLEHTAVSQIKLLDEFRNTDVVMLCYNAAKLYDINCGFLSQALVELSLDDESKVSAILEQIKDQMRSSSQWYESLKQKAAQQNKPFEQVMDEDAFYILYLEPEKYLD
ncbi:MAG: hypothetical protein IJ057_09220 [Bacteroidales bacterium]|nr:hypothetical protein [Bacteroidales bacterium]